MLIWTSRPAIVFVEGGQRVKMRSSVRRRCWCTFNVMQLSGLLQEAGPYEEAMSLIGAWMSGGSEVADLKLSVWGYMKLLVWALGKLRFGCTVLRCVVLHPVGMIATSGGGPPCPVLGKLRSCRLPLAIISDGIKAISQQSPHNADSRRILEGSEDELWKRRRNAQNLSFCVDIVVEGFCRSWGVGEGLCMTEEYVCIVLYVCTLQYITEESYGRLQDVTGTRRRKAMGQPQIPLVAG